MPRSTLLWTALAIPNRAAADDAESHARVSQSLLTERLGALDPGRRDQWMVIRAPSKAERLREQMHVDVAASCNLLVLVVLVVLVLLVVLLVFMLFLFFSGLLFALTRGPCNRVPGVEVGRHARLGSQQRMATAILGGRQQAGPRPIWAE